MMAEGPSDIATGIGFFGVSRAMSWIKAFQNVRFKPLGVEAFLSNGDAARSEPPIANMDATRPSFDAIGQRDETVRQRISMMIDRLDDLKSLQDDFAELMSPLVRISDELSRASIRIVDLEHLVAQERQSSGAHRDEAAGLRSRLGAIESELSDTAARAVRAESELQDSSTAIDELRMELSERTAATEGLERQLFAEAAQTRVLNSENKALRAEAQNVDATLARAEHDLRGAYERLSIFEKDNERLQSLSEEQGAQLAELVARHEELEKTADLDRQKARALETQLALQTEAHERREAQFEAEISAFRTERVSLSMKLESAESRAAAAQQMLAQARNQLREKDEAYRVADRNFKEAIIARSTADRLLQSSQADLAKQTERFVEMQRTRTDLEARCDMLGKALAAKDSAIDQSATRNAAMADRIAQLTSDQETMRGELEATIRRLKDELQNERSERALMQGALDIARESRVALQKQNETLKRSSRVWRDAPQEEAQSDFADGRQEDNSNVRPFASNSKPA